MDLKSIVKKNDNPAGRAFDFFIQALIFISLISFSIETLPNLNSDTQYWLSTIETVVVIIFTIEYLLRIYFSDSKLSYIFSFYGVVDFLAIAPFYLSLGLDLRSLRILRMFRLFRLFKFVRYNKAIQRFHRAFLIVKEELVLFGMITLMFLYISAVGIYYCENEAQPEQFKSIFHSFWWAIVTFTTVGYGDVYPITLGGRLFTFIMLMTGLGIVAIPSGLIASALTQIRAEDEKKRRDQIDEGDN